MKEKKCIKVSIMLLLASLFMLTSACSKNMGAEDIAKKFLADIEEGKAYTLQHRYIETGETLELHKDSDGNVMSLQTFKDGTQNTIYYVDGDYTVLIDGVPSTEYEDGQLKDFLDTVLLEAPYYIEDSLEVFNIEIASDILEDEQTNTFIAVGQYEDGSAYKYSYERQGIFFEILDAYDDVRIELDEKIVVTLPNEY